MSMIGMLVLNAESVMYSGLFSMLIVCIYILDGEMFQFFEKLYFYKQ